MVIAARDELGRVETALERRTAALLAAQVEVRELDSPIQYIKSTRLHQTRLLLMRDGLTAASASARVGYESPSQFSREFKRLFGRSPADEARDRRASFALSPTAEIDDFAGPH